MAEQAIFVSGVFWITRIASAAQAYRKQRTLTITCAI
jgi:hypothetical protein